MVRVVRHGETTSIEAGERRPALLGGKPLVSQTAVALSWTPDLGRIFRVRATIESIGKNCIRASEFVS